MQEIALPTKEYLNMMDLYSESLDVEGEVATCNLGGIVHANIESMDDLEDVAYYTLLMIDKTIHMADYALPNVGAKAKARLNAGVGIIGLAHLMAKNKKSYTTVEGKKFIHEVAERHAYALIKASLKLGKELGNAPWIHKTKWPQGWLPIDTYNKNVDKIADFELKMDWETLRKEIIENGGIRNSVLIAMMPSESSANNSGTTNGLYPIRDLSLIKTDNNRVNYWAAPEGEKYEKWYDIAWDVPTNDLIDMYAIVQKFTDQGISADLYRKVLKGDTVSSSEMVNIVIYMVKMGLKSRYYMNMKTSDGSFFTENIESEEDCESCKL